MEARDKDRLARIERKVDAILREQKIEMKEIDVATDELTQAYEALKTKVEAAVAAEDAGATELKELHEKIEAITPGSTITAAQLTELANALGTATEAITSAK